MTDYDGLSDAFQWVDDICDYVQEQGVNYGDPCVNLVAEELSDALGNLGETSTTSDESQS